MRFGCCLNMIAKGPDGTGIEYIEALAKAGFDYAELPLAEMMALPDGQFQELVRRVAGSGVHCEACNNFFPKTERLTGESADLGKSLDYARRAMDRAALLGAERLVFGSGGAKNVPEGFPMEKGYAQVVELLGRLAPEAVARNITISIEPLRKAECNLINTFQEGCRLADDVGADSVRVLVDYYHLTEEQEPAYHVADLGPGHLAHVHFARPEGRVYPNLTDGHDYSAFAAALLAAGYDGRVSCEAYTQNFEQDAPQALLLLKRVLSHKE